MFIDPVQDHIHNALPFGLLQAGAGSHIGHDLDVRPGTLNAFGNGTSNEPQANKSYGGIGH